VIDRLINWSHWAKSRPFYPASCKSLESRYRPPPCWHPPEFKAEIDILDAYKVEKGIVRLPRRNMSIIIYAYITPNRDFDIFCRKAKIMGTKELNKSDAFIVEQRFSEKMLINVLDQLEKQA